MRLNTLSVHTSLLSAMLGASIALAIQSGTAAPSAWVLAAILVLILHAVNFYHGKLMAFGELHAAAAEARPVVHSTLLLSNTTLFVLFCLIAARIADSAYLAGGEIAVRAFDALLVMADLRLGDRPLSARSVVGGVRRQLQYWLGIDVVAILLLTAALLFTQHDTLGGRYHVIVIVFASVTLADLLIEYGRFRANYFYHRGDNWALLAERWDRLQGEFGDDYRRAILHPHVLEWAAGRGVACCVDLGCGNGCTCRTLADSAHIPVLGVDAAPPMLDLANLYESRALVAGTVPRACSYVQAAIGDAKLTDDASFEVVREAVSRLRDNAGGPCGALAMFLPQDCAQLDGLMAWLGALIAPGEPLLLVYENEAGFDASASHTVTVRAWKYSWRRATPAVQIISWLPVVSSDRSSLFAGTADRSADPINTITHYRTQRDYVAAAGLYGFVPTSSGPILMPGLPSTRLELIYDRQPKFSFVEFLKEA